MSSPNNETILIVDDDQGPRRSLAMIIEQAGYFSLERATGIEGLELAAQAAPDLVLLDLKLPDHRGTDLLERFIALDSELPVVIITAYASLETAVAAVNHGAASYLIKPLDAEKLLATIEQLLDRRRLQRDNELLNRQMRRELEARRRAESSRDMLSQAIEAAGDAIIVTDRDGVILYSNPASDEITGRRACDVIGRRLNEMDECVKCGDQMFTRGPGLAPNVDIVRQRAGKNRHLEGSVTPVTDGEGTVLRRIHVWRDVTEQRQLESIAQSVNVMNNIGYVFSGIRHELGNPVNALQMTLKVVETHMQRDDSSGAVERLALARSELEKIQFLLRSLKSFNMFERLELQRLELSPFITQFRDLVKPDCVRRGVSFTVEIAPQDIYARADPRALQQVLLNVLTNALDATSHTKDPSADLTVTGDGVRTTLTVRDNGDGFAEEALANAYRPFVTTKAHGTGLGLVIAKKLMTQMGGTIKVTNRSGRGTRVELTLDGSALERH